MVYGRLIAAWRLRYPRYRSPQNDFAIAFARRDRHPHNTCPTTSTRQRPGRTPELTSATSTSSGATTRIHRHGHDGESRRRSIRADTFRDEGLYAFRFDLDQTRVQNFEVRCAFGSTASSGVVEPHCSRAHWAPGRDGDRGEGFRWLGSGSLRRRRHGLRRIPDRSV
jgi:hypothetical protein